MLSFSAGIHVVVWEECYSRWRALTDSINDASEINTWVDGVDSSSQSHSLTQQVRFLSLCSISAISRSGITGSPFSMAKSDVIPCRSERVMYSIETGPFTADRSDYF